MVQRLNGSITQWLNYSMAQSPNHPITQSPLAHGLHLKSPVVLNLYRGAIVMKKVLGVIFTLVMAFSIVFIGDASPASGQSMKGTVTATKHRTYRGGKYVAHKTVHGTKWTAHKVKRGTKWSAHKTKRGTKWTYHKTKHGTKWTAHKTKRGTKSIFHKTKEAVTQ
jgi:hypothetical protein